MLYIISVFDRSDDTLRAWTVPSEDQIVPTLKEEYKHEDLDLPETQDGVKAALDAVGYSVFVTEQEDPGEWPTSPERGQDRPARTRW